MKPPLAAWSPGYHDRWPGRCGWTRFARRADVVQIVIPPAVRKLWFMPPGAKDTHVDFDVRRGRDRRADPGNYRAVPAVQPGPQRAHQIGRASCRERV